ncbi:MAG: type II/IV secretion system ATPase subunit [Candidatus Nanoarchaeia archaeon]
MPEQEQKRSGVQNFLKVDIDFSPQIPKMSRIEDKTKIDVRYCLISPFAFAHIYWDPKIYEVVYEIEEPLLNSKEEEYRRRILNAMNEMISFDIIVENDLEGLLGYIDQRFKFLLVELGIDISYESYKKIYYYLCRDFIGFNEIEPLLRDYFIEDIENNGADTPLYIVHRLYRNMKTNIIFKDLDKLEGFVEKLAQRSGQYISYANPILDGSLPDGSRVNATYTKDISSKGPTFTIRKFTKEPWTPVQLVSFNTLSPEMISYLWLLIQYKMNILITGGTSSGKTTLLNAIAFFMPPEARVVSIEDTRELNLPRDNWLPSVSRSSSGVRGIGSVSLFDLLRSSFRQNPDYVIVGEVRGREASVLFQGMASGHSSVSTIHSDSVESVIRRLETPPIELPPTLLNVLDCVCIMTHAIVNKEETRRLREIVELIDVSPEGIALTNTPFTWNASDDTFYFKRNSKVFEKISSRYGLSIQELESEFRIRTQLIYELFKRKVFGFKRVQDIVNEYYKRPKELLAEFDIKA